MDSTSVQRHFVDRAKRLRHARSVSQREVAEHLAMDPSSYARIETGERHLRLGEAAVLAAVLGTTVDHLLGDEPLTVEV